MKIKEKIEIKGKRENNLKNKRNVKPELKKKTNLRLSKSQKNQNRYELNTLKAYNLFLTGFLLITFFMPFFLVEPCSASFVTSNNITLEKNGMTWEYQEQVTGNESIVFRNLIDLQEGNHDKFVNAWEILKAEAFLRNQTKESIRTKPDVKLNGTSEPVKVTDVDVLLSKEALGKTSKNSSITNSANVSYIFEKEIGQGTNIWFMGTPNSNVTIALPVGFDVERTEGLDNKSQESKDNRMVLKGNFSPEKNVTLWISENESYKAELKEKEGKAKQSVENKSKEKENKTIATGEPTEIWTVAGSFQNIFKIFLHRFL